MIFLKTIELNRSNEKRLIRSLFLIAPIALLILFTARPAAADYTYIVQPGDTLFRIALNHGLKTEELAEANGINDVSKIYSGQLLIIPENSVLREGEQGASTRHIVRSGETLFKIAVRYGLSMREIAQANNIYNRDLVFAGQTLIIPNALGADLEASIHSEDLSGAANEEAYSGSNFGERWIDVNLTTQLLTAYEGQRAAMSTSISSGLWPHNTVTGEFAVYIRYLNQDMNGYRLGYDYYLEDVPYVMYFYKDYALHGTYWHNNFGNPMSHGCVNLTIADAQWLYNWSSYGTVVNIHY